MKKYLFIIYLATQLANIECGPTGHLSTGVTKKCRPPICPQIRIKCEEGSTYYEDPSGCSCPTCKKIPCTTEKPKVCDLSFTLCEALTCEKGYAVFSDPNVCACPTCKPIADCPPRSCPLINCIAGYKPVSKGCACSTCEPDSPPCDPPFCPDINCEKGRIIHDPTGCTCPKCETKMKRPCPLIKCAKEYESVIDPETHCPTCRCRPRVCPLIARICDPDNPPPPPSPCGCPSNCFYPELDKE